MIPQIYKSYRAKSTTGLSEYLLLLWAIAGSFLGVYVITQNLNIPLILQTQLFTTLSTVSWIQCQYYGRKRPLITCLVIFFAALLIVASFEVGMVFATRPALKAGNLKPIHFFGIFSSILLSAGLFPQYYEIYKHGEVIGISMMFMFIDWFGGVTSTISLGFKETFDIIAGIAYGLIVLLDGFVLLAYLILNPIARKRRRAQQENLSIEAAPNDTSPIINPEEKKDPETTPPSRGTVGDEEKASEDPGSSPPSR